MQDPVKGRNIKGSSINTEYYMCPFKQRLLSLIYLWWDIMMWEEHLKGWFGCSGHGDIPLEFCYVLGFLWCILFWGVNCDSSMLWKVQHKLLFFPNLVLLWLQVIQRFAIVDLSNFYFDVAKDRLYVGYVHWLTFFLCAYFLYLMLFSFLMHYYLSN